MDFIWGYTPDEIRPFPALTYQLAALAGAASPVLNHAINIACHAVNGVLVLGIARAAGLAVPAAALAGIAFVVLPVQAETVAWVTGRVDSLPALFYLAAFLLYVRSGSGSDRRRYLWSLAMFVIALFSKQNTITLGPALVLYDLVVTGERPRPAWSWMRRYVPYALLTLGYLGLRYVIFGEVAREGTLTAERLGYVAADAARHLQHIVLGAVDVIPGVQLAMCVAAAIVAVVALSWRAGATGMPALFRVALYFGVVWMALGIAPTLVAGYASPRHVYLASVGWAVLLGVGVELSWRARPSRVFKTIAAAAVAALLAMYVVRLHRVVDDWGVRTSVSQAAVRDLEREALAAPEGTLIIVGMPARSWEYSLPFAARPPFTRADVTRRVSLVYHAALHCCSATQWDEAMRAAMQCWQAHAERPPVIALYWNPRTGRMTRVSDRDEPYLRSLIDVFLSARSVAAMNRAIDTTLEELVAPREQR